jgi:hypothetical protein
MVGATLVAGMAMMAIAKIVHGVMVGAGTITTTDHKHPMVMCLQWEIEKPKVHKFLAK